MNHQSILKNSPAHQALDDADWFKLNGTSQSRLRRLTKHELNDYEERASIPSLLDTLIHSYDLRMFSLPIELVLKQIQELETLALYINRNKHRTLVSIHSDSDVTDYEPALVWRALALTLVKQDPYFRMPMHTVPGIEFPIPQLPHPDEMERLYDKHA